jgi:hypothetical protein
MGALFQVIVPVGSWHCWHVPRLLTFRSRLDAEGVLSGYG